MAEAGILINQDQFNCPVCLDLLKDPVTTPCGHNFCKLCINRFWDDEDQKRVFSCPQCRETFTPRPVLRKNNTLAEVVEKLKKTQLKDGSSVHCYAEPEDMKCDCCIERKRKAVNSCLVCQASNCKDHLQPHYQSQAFKKHKLDEASAELQEKNDEQSGLTAVGVPMIFPSDLMSREYFLNYFCYLTLDPNTAHGQLILSKNNRSVAHTSTEQRYSEHPERFDSRPQVLCKESVSGSCYWEVEWSGSVSISVSYKEISRKGGGNKCGFGYNRQSWSLQCSSSSVSFWHNDNKTELHGPTSSRIGVFVDHSAGTVSFYSFSDMMRLLHRVHATFTQPLYAGFRIWFKSTVRLIDPK